MSADSSTAVATESPSVVARGVVTAVEHLSPAFARVTFGGPQLRAFGTPGHTFDQRIKLIFPPASGVLPELDDHTGNWYAAWLALPEDQRGSMRTYSIRDLQPAAGGSQTSVVVDFVLHLEPGLTGPASRWASTAEPGDELILAGPRRGRTDGGGIEFDPGTATDVLLAGDETAAPAIARVLEDSGNELRGVAFIEVPEEADVLPIEAPPGVEVRWLPRAGRAHGEVLIPTVLQHLGDVGPEAVAITDVESENLLWETPRFSGLGEDIAEAANHDPNSNGERYFWIAGESGVVTTLRRHLVKDLGIDRSQVAFMGYWRKGVAMRG